MAYEKQNFADGQVLTAEHLNHIEEGIEAATPTFGSADYGKVLSASAEGLVWVDKPTDGSTGSNGTSIFYANVDIEYDENTIASYNVLLTDIETNGRTMQAGDLVLTRNGTLCNVDGTSLNNVTLSPKMSVKTEGSVLIVEYDSSAKTASHSASEINAAVESGTMVFLHTGDMMAPIGGASDTAANFQVRVSSTDMLLSGNYTVDNSKNVSFAHVQSRFVPESTDDTTGMILRSTGSKPEWANVITYGTEDLTAGTSELGTGTLYVVYE